MESNIEQRCELLHVKNSLIENQVEINCNLHIDSRTLTPIKTRQKTNTVKGKVPLKDISSSKQVVTPHTPFFTTTNVSDNLIMKMKIKGTLDYIDKLSSEEEKKGCIRELTNFVIQEFKKVSDQNLKTRISQLEASRTRRQTQEMKQNLFNILNYL